MADSQHSYRNGNGRFQAELARLASELKEYGYAPERSLFSLFHRVRRNHYDVIDGGILNVESQLTPLVTDLIDLRGSTGSLSERLEHINEAIDQILAFHTAWKDAHRKQVELYAADMADEPLPDYPLSEVRYPDDAPLEGAFETLLDLCGLLTYAIDDPALVIPGLDNPTEEASQAAIQRALLGDLDEPAFC